MSLDSMFGPTIPPRLRVQQWEYDFAPDSLTKLDSVSANVLKHTMEQIASGWKVGRVLTFDTLIIWLVDDDGDIWLALEELVWHGLPTGRPKHQRLALTATLPKLGHPALVGGARARIAGELYFDEGATPPVWTINNNSGRYGRHPSRTMAHLHNVVRRFNIYGITVTPHFVRA